MAKNKIDRFLDTVYSAAEAKSDKMIREIDRAREAALREYRAELRRGADAERRRETLRAARMGAESAAHDETEIRRGLLEKREAIAREVFAGVRRRLEEYRKTPEYKEALLRDAAKVAEMLTGNTDAAILISPADKSVAGEIETAAKIPVRTDSAVEIGGVLGISAEMECDCTLDRRLESAMADFAKESGLSVV